MRFRVQFAYNEETGEVEMFRVESLADGARARDHDEVHDRVSGELADVVEPGAAVQEEPPQARPRSGRIAPPATEQANRETPRTDTFDG